VEFGRSFFKCGIERAVERCPQAVREGFDVKLLRRAAQPSV
jgi:hypothetical protein